VGAEYSAKNVKGHRNGEKKKYLNEKWLHVHIAVIYKYIK